MASTILFWQKIMEIKGFSAGDQEDLLNWLSALKNKPSKVFPVHGETSPQMNCE
jgi:metallo-beta-lactamase family protein